MTGHHCGTERIELCTCPRNTRSAHESLAVVVDVGLWLDYRQVFGFQVVKKISPFRLALWVCIDPCLKLLFDRFLLLNYIKSSKTCDLAAVKLLHIAQGEIIIRVLEPYLRILVHPALDDLHLLSTELIADRMSQSLIEIGLV